jgi:hypothetical protein
MYREVTWPNVLCATASPGRGSGSGGQWASVTLDARSRDC